MNLQELLQLLGSKEVELWLTKKRIAELEEALKAATAMPPKGGVE